MQGVNYLIRVIRRAECGNCRESGSKHQPKRKEGYVMQKVHPTPDHQGRGNKRTSAAPLRLHLLRGDDARRGRRRSAVCTGLDVGATIE